MTHVDKFFDGYRDLHSIAGGLKALARAFERTGNTIMQEELLCWSEDIISAREQMYEGFHEAISVDLFSVKENGAADPKSSV